MRRLKEIWSGGRMMAVSRFAAVISVRICTSQYDRLGRFGEMGSWCKDYWDIPLEMPIGYHGPPRPQPGSFSCLYCEAKITVTVTMQLRICFLGFYRLPTLIARDLMSN